MKIDSRLQSLICPLSESEKNLLKQQVISTNGPRDALIVWQEEDILLDGHNRLEICQELGYEYQVKYLNFLDMEEASTWIINNQLGRRNASPEQISYYRGWRYNHEKNGHGGDRASAHCEHLKTCDKLAQEYNIDKSTIKRDGQFSQSLDNLCLLLQDNSFRIKVLAKDSKYSKKDIIQLANSQDAIELINLIETEEAKNLKEAKKILKRNKRVSDEISSIDGITLYCDDFRNIQIPENSIDVIITDPPYPEEYLYLYEDLGYYADKVLKNGGSLLVMCGQSYLPQILSLLSKSSLKYQWCLSYLTPGGQAPQLWDRKVNCFWKPIFWFVKGEYKGDWQGDVLKSKPNDNDKRFHDWGQSESGMLSIVEAFSFPDEIILDPFMGGATTGMACIATDRNFIGIEIDKEIFETAKERLYAIYQETK